MAARALAIERLARLAERRRAMRIAAIETALAKLQALLGDPEEAIRAYLEMHPLADPEEVREAAERLSRAGGHR